VGWSRPTAKSDNVMIENPNPRNWHELQISTCKILNEIGLSAEIGRVFITPRGKVELDVYAVDEKSVDKIQYIVECKNWSKAVPQSVVHSFTTVMNEVGANIGFIISKKGLQVGAKQYTENTNIIGLSYAEFQQRYFNIWFERYFVTKIGDVVDPLVQYIEPFNAGRDKKIGNLSGPSKRRYFTLLEEYQAFGIAMSFFEFPRYLPTPAIKPPQNIEELKRKVEVTLDGKVHLQSVYYRDLLCEILTIVNDVTDKFNSIFGENIFLES
jgi:Restriction endonuclease